MAHHNAHNGMRAFSNKCPTIFKLNYGTLFVAGRWWLPIGTIGALPKIER